MFIFVVYPFNTLLVLLCNHCSQPSKYLCKVVDIHCCLILLYLLHLQLNSSNQLHILQKQLAVVCNIVKEVLCMIDLHHVSLCRLNSRQELFACCYCCIHIMYMWIGVREHDTINLSGCLWRRNVVAVFIVPDTR